MIHLLLHSLVIRLLYVGIHLLLSAWDAFNRFEVLVVKLNLTQHGLHVQRLSDSCALVVELALGLLSVNRAETLRVLVTSRWVVDDVYLVLNNNLGLFSFFITSWVVALVEAAVSTIITEVLLYQGRVSIFNLIVKDNTVILAPFKYLCAQKLLF